MIIRLNVFLVIVSVVFLLFSLGFIFFFFYPEVAIEVNPESTPFIGKNQANAFLNSSCKFIDHTGRSRAHKVILFLLLALIFLKPFWGKIFQTYTGIKTVLNTKKPIIRLQKFAFWTGVLIFLFPLLVGLGKVPDFSSVSNPNMAITNIHYTVVVGQGDLVLGGARLLDEINPTYGAFFTTIIGIISLTQGKLIALGSIIRWVQWMDIFYWLLIILCYWKWSKHQIAYMIPAILFLLPWFYSSEGALVPINHSPIRTLGIALCVALVVLYSKKQNCWLCWWLGSFGCLSLLINVESGIAANAGIVTFLFFQKVLASGFKEASVVKMIFTFGVGFACTFLMFNIIFMFFLNYLPTWTGWKNYFLPAIFGASGSWAVEYRFDFWPIFMFLHVCFYLCMSLFSVKTYLCHSKRAMIGIIFLVWFAYFVSRPDPEYLSSYYFLYGFVLIDLVRMLRSSLLKTNISEYSLIPAILVFLVVFGKSLDVVQWSWNPFKWDVKNQMRWQVSLSKRKNPEKPNAIYYGRTFLSADYWHDLKLKSDFLISKIDFRKVPKLVFFTTDSYLLPRISGILPFQFSSDPILALNKSSYDKMLLRVIQSPFDEIYFDARDEKSLVWYGGMFQMVRRDLGEHFQKVGVESGWEIWKRISKN